MTGNTLTFVEKLDDIENIWTKLISSFGNIATAIAILLYRMFELEALAEKFKLKEEYTTADVLKKFLAC